MTADVSRPARFGSQPTFFRLPVNVEEKDGKYLITAPLAGFKPEEVDVTFADGALTISAKRGLDLSRFRSRPLVPAVVTGADLIIVMDSRQAEEIAARFPVNRARIVIAGDLDPKFDQTRAIRDPWNQPSEVFEASFDRLDRCAAVLISLLERRSTEAGGQLLPE